jgi:hypothetical protein
MPRSLNKPNSREEGDFVSEDEATAAPIPRAHGQVCMCRWRKRQARGRGTLLIQRFQKAQLLVTVWADMTDWNLKESKCNHESPGLTVLPHRNGAK